MEHEKDSTRFLMRLTAHLAPDSWIRRYSTWRNQPWVTHYTSILTMLSRQAPAIMKTAETENDG